MISHAQNAEDVVLARALSADHGFYVDVGAADPDRASVTKHFYELGWQGINIEPRAEAIAEFIRRRPRDVNLAVAAGSADGELTLHRIIDDPDLSTTDPDTAAALGEQQHSAEVVAVRTLDGILAEHQVGELDFLKIDVEGAERVVLEGLDLARWRPRVVVIEAVRPWTGERVDDRWRDLLDRAGYLEASFDGVNLFFVRGDERHLIPRLAPASVLDDFRPAGVQLLVEEIDRLREYTKHLEAELAQRSEVLDEAEDYARHLERALAPVADESPVPDPRPPRPVKLAVIGSPRMGNTWIRRVLADALGAVELPVHHPADLDWDDLPERAILQLHWLPSQRLAGLLAANGFLVVSPARHPLDTLLSVLTFAQRDTTTDQWLSGAGGDESALRGAAPLSLEFERWARSERAQKLLQVSVDWRKRPSTAHARYEDLCAEPRANFARLLADVEQPVDERLDAAIAANTPARLLELSGGKHVWHGRPGLHRELLTAELAERLVDSHREVFESLDYPAAVGGAPDAAAAVAAWERLRGA